MSNKLKDNPWFNYPDFQWNKKHAVIIGGGVAGCQMAWHLCQENWSVTLIERHKKLATEASGNMAGVISPKMTSQESLGEDFYTAGFKYTLKLLETLEQQGKNIDWDKCGALQLTHNIREEKRWEILKQRDFPTDFLQLLDEKQTSEKAAISLPYKASYFPQAGWVKPASFCQALTNHPNCTIIVESEALSLKKVDKHWQVLNQNNEEIAQAEAIIICSGKDLLKLEQSSHLPIMPVAGQTTFATTGGESQKLQTVIGHEGYLTPAIGGQHIFGATFERNFDNRNNPRLKTEADNQNCRQLNKYLPAFFESLSNIKSAHAAVRMTTPDRFPYAGALPEQSFYANNYHDLHQGKQYKSYPQAKYQTGLFVLGGLGSRGLTTSGLCAKMISDLMNNKNLDQPFSQNCHPARFLIKQLKTNTFQA